jgi:hypothetical protein
LSDQKTPERVSGEGDPSISPAVGYSVVSFMDTAEPNQEMIGFSYFETEENTITWVWESDVVSTNIIIPYHRIKDVVTRFEATGN